MSSIWSIDRQHNSLKIKKILLLKMIQMLNLKAAHLFLPSFCKSLRFANFSSRATEEPPYLELQRDFIEPAELYGYLKKNGIDFYSGVPDSLLKDFCAYVTDNTPSSNHIIAANEGLALSLAVGYHLATKRIPCVYMQNSGLGNIVNPLLSLAHPKVYGIPMLLLIGWRGEPGKKDEPQHLVQGKRMVGLLTEMGLQHEVLPDYIEGAQEAIDSAIFNIKKRFINIKYPRQTPYALLVRRQCFSNYKLQNEIKHNFEMNREQALEVIVPSLGDHDVIVATTGFLSRELYEIRKKGKQTGEQDFYTVGSMGHASSIALGIAMVKKSRSVYCFDGDGAALMHLGSFATVGQIKPQNLKHVIFNNGSHDSVGAQPSAGFNIDFPGIALASGYQEAISVSTKTELHEAIISMKSMQGPILLEIKIRNGARKDLGRPLTTTLDNKSKFMQFLEQ